MLRGYRQFYSVHKDIYIKISKKVETRFDTSNYYLINDLINEGSEGKKAKSTKTCLVKTKFNLEIKKTV